ncbi:MAG: hypothetical protein HYR73_06440 [Candidatus Eisenbacteria bacterium]|nr:hypothetical protein [Candidatus Eisenbacteria bacterium]
MTAWLPLFLMLVAEPATHGPTVAREDTLSTSVSEVLVRAPRVTLDEILDRVARGEARRDSLIRDQSFRFTLRVVRNTVGDKAPVLMQEEVYQVYRKRPGLVRSDLLRERREHPRSENGVRVQFSKGFGEEIVTFAFHPSARREFTYRIVGRDLVGGHLIYRIAFRPRSALDPSLPGGQVWIDTNEFVIVRQEITFERSPVAAFLKGIDRMVVERERVGDLWVLKRVLLRAELTFSIPRVGRAFDLGLFYDDYAINSGLPDSLFKGHEQASRASEQ